MAVVQISRIQVRRGQENTGTGLPQLASGELAWAVDTQRLYIGNGSVAEGSPYVGNTEILTNHTELLSLIGSYQFAKNIPEIQTGPNSSYPVVLNLQDIIDSFVTINYFIAPSDIEINDFTAAIQRAIDQLFLNPAFKNQGTTLDESARVDLQFGPGVFTITSPIYVPSYVTLTGSGIDKTFFNFTGTGNAFVFINDTSTYSARNTSAGITYNTQPKDVLMRHFTITLNNDNSTALNLNYVRDSNFENIGIESISETSLATANTTGIALHAISTLVTCENNNFDKLKFNNLSCAINSNEDIYNNSFNNCRFTNLYKGVEFGVIPGGTGPNQLHGPRKNKIANSTFDTVYRQAILIAKGEDNRSEGNSFANVGNDGSNNYDTQVTHYSHIEFIPTSNISSNDIFDRSADLAATHLTSPYVAEVKGPANHFNLSTNRITITGTGTNTVPLFKIPLTDAITYEVDYIYRSSTHGYLRQGKMYITADKTNNKIQLADEYEFIGVSGDDTKLIVSATLLDSDTSGTKDSIQVYYKNSASESDGSLTYTYRTFGV
jgi:hypothetical protein